MKRLLAAAALVLAFGFGRPAAGDAGPRAWWIDVPVGWVDVSAESNQLPDAQAQIAQLQAISTRVERVVYASPDDHLLQIIHSVSPQRGKGTITRLTSWEAGARNGSRKNADAEVSYEPTEERHLVIGDQALAIGDSTLYVRRIVGENAAGELVMVSAACGGADACRAAVRSVRLDRSGFRSLAELRKGNSGGRGSAEESQGYREGKLLATVCGIGICLFIVIRGLRR